MSENVVCFDRALEARPNTRFYFFVRSGNKKPFSINRNTNLNFLMTGFNC